jgi:TolB-like protein
MDLAFPRKGIQESWGFDVFWPWGLLVGFGLNQVHLHGFCSPLQSSFGDFCPMSRAVFLSYASQDSEAARSLCEALQAKGVEVWFDQGELRGGDEWDHSIRRQIKACALFIPIVSANSQARREGYFRLEWKLADDRTHLIAKGTPFILPVCVDGTNDWDAIVPESFTTVQWTRLPPGAAPDPFVERVRRLLGGAQDSVALPGSNRTAAIPKTDGVAPHDRRRLHRVTALALLVAAVVAAAWFVTRKPVSPQESVKTLAVSIPAQAPTPNVNERSLVVLPLENLSPDPENAFFTDGMHAEIISTLSRLSDLKVISRISAVALKGTTLSLAEIGNKLNVANIISGSVNRSGNRVRIQLELRRASDEALLWSQDYDRHLEDVIDIQAEIAGNVARVLQARESKGLNSGAAVMSRDPRAYDLYMKAQQVFLAGMVDYDPSSDLKAAKLAEEALNFDPELMPAASLISEAQRNLFWKTTDPAEKIRHASEAKRWAETASRLMPGGGGNAALSLYYSSVEIDYEHSRILAEEAIRALPNDAKMHDFASFPLLGLNRPDESLSELKKAISLDPLDVILWENVAGLLADLRRADEFELTRARCLELAGNTGDRTRLTRDLYVIKGELPTGSAGQGDDWLWRRRKFAEELASLESELSLPDSNEVIRFDLLLKKSDVLHRLGRESQAAAAATAARAVAATLEPQAEFDPSEKDLRLSLALARLGNPEESISACRHYVEARSPATQTNDRWGREVHLAEIYAYLDRPGECVGVLAQLLRVPCGLTVPILKIDPVWDPVRNDQGFKALLLDPKNLAPL